MRFTCDKCSAKFTIADEKVRGKIVAVKCSKCGNKITVNGKTLVPVQEEVVEERTRVASLVDVEAALRQSQAAAGPSPSPRAPKAPEPPPPATAPDFEEGWHAIIDRQQLGPLSADELKAHIEKGKLTARTYVWRDGQGDWKRASDVPAFARALAPKPAAPTPAPPPPKPAPAPTTGARKAAPKNGSNGAEAVQVVQPAAVTKPRQVTPEDFDQEDRPTLQRDLDVASFEAMAMQEAGEPAPEQRDLSSTMPRGDQGPLDPELPASEPAAEPPPPEDRQPEPDPAAAPAADQDLNSLLFDDAPEVSQSGPAPLDLANAVARDLDKKAKPGEAVSDPFAKVPDNPNISKPGEIGEATRFFMNKAGVSRRNPPWKIAVFVLLVIGLPIAVLYALSQFKVYEIKVTTAVDESGQEIKTSVFTPEGLSGIRDLLLKKPKPVVKPAPKPKAPPKPTPGAGDVKRPEDEGPLVAKPDIKFDSMTDEEKKRMAEAAKDLGSKTPQVDPKLLEQKLQVDGNAGLDGQVVAEVFGKNVKAFQTCVEAELRRNPAFKGGKVNILFTVGPSGIVTKATLDRPDIDGTELGKCLKERAKRMVFPSFQGEPFDVESPLIMAKGT